MPPRSSLSPLIGALLGLLLCGIWPQRHLGSLTLFFPPLDPALYQQLCQALDAQGAAGPVESGSQGPAHEQLAWLVLASQAAAGSARLESPVRLERLSSGLRVQVVAGSPERARQQLEQLLAYLDKFLQDHPVYPYRRTRLALEGRLGEVAQHLLELEAKLQAPKGAASGVQAGRVQAEMWLRRSEEEATGRAILDTLRQLRGEELARSSEYAWVQRWLKGKPSASPARPGVRRFDLKRQAGLERNYQDTLLRYRMLLLQLSFLQTLEGLTDTHFEVVDPASVRPQPKGWAWLAAAAVGAVLGGLLGRVRRP